MMFLAGPRMLLPMYQIGVIVHVELVHLELLLSFDHVLLLAIVLHRDITHRLTYWLLLQ